MKSLIDKPTELFELINECLKPKEVEKKKFGEVFTPMALIDEMLDKLPIDVWLDENLKWLDIANGIGNFLIAIYLRLMQSLKGIIEDDAKRKKHILENMLYMCELNEKNVLLTKQIFDINDEYKLNIFYGDSLTLDYYEYFGVKKFDVIVGNPPYNKNNTGIGYSIYQLFIIKAFELLKKGGYITYVHPPAWRKPISEKSKHNHLFKMMTTENQMLYLEIHNSSHGYKTFKAKTRYDWYVIQKIKNYMPTTIKGEDTKIVSLQLNKWDFLPNFNFEKIYSLIAKKHEPTCEIIYHASNYSQSKKKYMSTEKNEEFKYTIIHTTPKKGTRYFYSSRNDNGHFGIPKIIFGITGIYNSIIDIDGKYGMSDCAMGLKITNINEANEIKKYIETDEFRKNILKACSWSNFRIDWRLFTYLKKNFFKS